jgi:hypothetical protein
MNGDFPQAVQAKIGEEGVPYQVHSKPEVVKGVEIRGRLSTARLSCAFGFI